MNATEMNSVEIQLLKEQVEFIRKKIQQLDGIYSLDFSNYPTLEKDFERIAKELNH